MFWIIFLCSVATGIALLAKIWHFITHGMCGWKRTINYSLAATSTALQVAIAYWVLW